MFNRVWMLVFASFESECRLLLNQAQILLALLYSVFMLLKINENL